MRLSTLITLVLLTTTSARGFSQNISLHAKSTKLEVVLKQIEKKSGYSFVYERELVQNRKPVTTTALNLPLPQLLEHVFADQAVDFVIRGKFIILQQRAPAAATKGQATALSAAKITQQESASGAVRDTAGTALIGVSVTNTRTNLSTQTDAHGKFSITANPGDVLRFSYLGYSTREEVLQRLSPLEIVLRVVESEMEGVVVTALGIRRSARALNYNVQQVDGEELTRVKDANLMNALAGKVAGATINTSSGGVGGATKVVIRGAKQIEKSNNVLYVIDGIPLTNFTGDQGTEFGSAGTTESIADFNPEDVESMSVLTGAAASALYGSLGANGVVLITTKRGKAGRTSITLSQNTEFLTPLVTPTFQNRYGTGSGLSAGVADRSWGLPLNDANFRGYVPTEHYFNNGVNATEALSFSTGTERNQTYASVAALNSAGIIPNNGYDRYNFTIRNTSKFLEERMTLDLGGSYIIQQDRNMTNQGTYMNPLVSAYLFPRGDDWNDIAMYERYDTQRSIATQYWPQELNEFSGQNPYWINYRNVRQNKRNRYMYHANLTYRVFDWLSLSSRARVDNTHTDFTENFYATTNPLFTDGSSNGLYGIRAVTDRQIYADVMANINKTFGDFSLQATLGGILQHTAQDFIQNRGPIRQDGIPNLFNIQQLDYANTLHAQGGWAEQTQSVFASAEVGFKDTYYMTVTGRNDWPSMLAGPNSGQSSFFYPSIGASVILSEILPLPEAIPYLKLRSSYASVGLPYSRFLANPTFPWNARNLRYMDRTHYPMPELLAERTNSFELGLASKFLNGFDMDISVYHTETFDQTFNPKISVSSMYDNLFIQAGRVRNRGLELSFGYNRLWDNFRWSPRYILSVNENKIMELVRDYRHPETGNIINEDRLDVGGLSQSHFILKEGGTLGDLYSLQDIQRDSNGDIYIDPSGNVSKNSNVGDILLGTTFPRSNMSLKNDFSWKNLTASFMVSARLGGIVYSATQATLDQYGASEASALARDQGGVLVNGGDLVNAERWYSVVGSNGGIPTFYAYSATNVRLQEASISYSFPKAQFWKHGDISLSLVGRNLWMIYNKAPFDPETTPTTGNYYQGIDYFMMPSLRSLGFNVRLNF